MKTKLIKLMLCAMALLPMGAWAAIDFGEEKTVSTTKTWVFNALTETVSSITSPTNEYYLRASSSSPTRNFTPTAIGSSETLTFADGYEVSATKYLLSNAALNHTSVTATMTAASTEVNGSSLIASASFAFNATVAGTVYAKIQGTASDNLQIYFTDGTNVTTHRFTATGNIDEIAFTSTGEGTFFIGDITKAFRLYAVRFVPSSVSKTNASTTKNWTFDKALIGTASVVYAGDGLYLRGYGGVNSTTTINSGRTLTVSAKTEGDPSSVTLGGEEITVTNVVTTYSGIQAPTSATKDASTISTNVGTPSLGIKTTVPGTLYVAMTPSTSSVENAASRIYFSDGSDNPASISSGQVSLPTAGTVYTPYAVSAKAGSFFIGAANVACKIYAVRFVPETVSTPTIENHNGTITITAGTSSISSSVTTYYTTDGSDPTSSGTRSTYTTPFPQTTTATIRAASVSSGLTASSIASKTVPTIPTALSSTTLNFAGLETSAVTVDDEDNFNINTTNKTYAPKDADLSALYIKDMIFSYSRTGATVTLSANYTIFNGSALTITIPGLTAGNIVTLSSSSNNSSAVTFACSSGGTIISGTTNSIQTTPTYTVIKSTGGNMVLTTTVAGLRLYSITVTSAPTATLDSYGYATFASPFKLDLTKMSASTGTVTAYKASVSGSTVTFNALSQKVPANTGILLVGSAGATITIPEADSSTDVEGNAFEVNEAGTTFGAESGYTYFGMKKNQETLTFAPFTPSSVAIPSNKAYLKVLTSEIGAHEMTFVFDDENTTGIDAMHNAQCIMHNEYFDLQGRRVAQPTKGLYIVNGKKVIIK